MNKLFKPTFLIGSILVIFIGCYSKKKIDTVKILIHATNYKAAEAKIKITDMFNMQQSDIADTKFDSTGTGVLEFKLNEPTLASLEISDRIRTIYLEPGYNLNVYLDENPDKPIRYEGKGSEANNYLDKTTRIQDGIDNSGGKNIFGLEQKEFLNRIDSLKRSLLDFYKHYNDSVKLPDRVSSLLEKRNAIITLLKVEIYGWNYGARNNNFNLPEGLNVLNEIPFDSSLLNIRMGEYAVMLQLYMYLKFFIPLEANKTAEEYEKIGDQAPIMVMNEINQNNYPSFMNEFLLAKNVDHWLTDLGIKPSVDSIYGKFKSKYPNSSTLSDLKIHYNKWLAISPGKPAPEITGLTLDGSKLSLSDLKGKVVYIDVWATWCGPCKAEIPHSKKLQKRFSKNEKVVFLYVSVDQDHEAWKKIVMNDKEWLGIHIIESKEEDVSSIYSVYNIAGVPRYILVDQRGNIVKADAPRPSSGDVIAKEIESLLEKNKNSL